MKEKGIRFAVIGDCHYSTAGNYATRDCMGAKQKLEKIIARLNRKKLDFVLSLGDLGDGHFPEEVPEMLSVYRQSVHPVRFAVGNHDLVLRTAAEFAALTKMPAPFYDFKQGGFRFIVLNAFEQSRYCPEGSEGNRAYWRWREENPALRVQEWPGLMTEASWAKLQALLDNAVRDGEDVIVISHVPAWYEALSGGVPYARIPDFRRMLACLDSCPNVRAYFAGHYHPGGIAVRKGVLHKTFKSVCDYAEETFCVAEADSRRIRLIGAGAETCFTHHYSSASSALSGTAPEGSWVMTNCGEITRVGASGKFSLRVPAPGIYALRAVKDGCSDAVLGHVEAPAHGLTLSPQPDPARKLYTGRTNGAAVLHIEEDGQPIRWFDADGKGYGSVYPDKPMWSEHSRNYWSAGRYAFTAAGAVTQTVLPKHPELTAQGWYKGDLHAHLIHGENIYTGNIQESAFIGRAEGYDWLYMAERYGNDGYPNDSYTLARRLSAPDFLLGLNQEFPKARSNHFGTIGLEAPTVQADMSKISSLQLAERYVWAEGGITVPVHPFYGHMACRELCLWLLCAPEKVPCIDFFYNDDFPRAMAEDYWFMLLNRGYRIGCFATSDAAFDVGRTPGSGRGATYVQAAALTEKALMEGMMNRRTMVSWDCAALLFSVDGAVSGDILPADGALRTLTVTAYWRGGMSGVLRIIRCGTELKRVAVTFAADDDAVTETLPVCETENSWYLAILESEDGKIRSAASPVYFRNDTFRAPEVLTLPDPVPPELLAFFESLTPEQLADPGLLEVRKGAPCKAPPLTPCELY